MYLKLVKNLDFASKLVELRYYVLFHNIVSIKLNNTFVASSCKQDGLCYITPYDTIAYVENEINNIVISKKKM